MYLGYGKGCPAGQQNSLIKSIQQAEVTISAGASSGTATITSVNTAYTALFYNGQRCSDTSINPSEDFARVTLTDATTITANTNSANAGASRIVSVTAVEFQPWAIRSIQYSTIDINAATSAFAAFSPTTGYAFPIYLGHSTDRTSYNLIRDTVGIIATGGFLFATRGSFSVADNIKVSYCTVEFNAGVTEAINTNEAGFFPASGSNPFDYPVIGTSSYPDATMMIQNGMNQYTVGVDDKRYFIRAELADGGSQIRSHVNTVPATSDQLIYVVVLRFLPKWIKSKQAGSGVIASGNSSKSDTITAVNTAKTMVSYLNRTTNTNSAGNDGAFPTVKLNSSTEVLSERGGTPATTCTTGYEVIEFY